MRTTLGIVVVDYHSISQTVDFVKNQLSLCKLDFKIVIVLNDCLEVEVQRLLAELPAQRINTETSVNVECGIFVLTSAINLGYAKGNNLGVEFLNKHFSPKFVCICNNDLNFEKIDPFPPLIEKLNSLNNVAAIGPRILGLDNQDQSPYRYISIIDKYLVRFIFIPIVNKFKPPRNKMKYGATIQSAKEGYYYRLMGCFILMKADPFMECGLFDPNTFLFGEENILSERLKKINFYCYYFPDVVIIHEHGATIHKYFKTKAKLMQEFKADSHYYKTYIGNGNVKLFLSKLSLHVFLMGANLKDKIGRLKNSK